MTNPPNQSPSMPQSDIREIQEILDKVAATFHTDGRQQLPLQLVQNDILDKATQAIEQLITNHTNAARADQIMQDELSLMDFDIDEADLIQWRIDRLSKYKMKQSRKN